MLCAICSDIDVDALTIPTTTTVSGTSHHTSLERLRDAASAGCSLCTAIDTMTMDRVQKARLDRMRHLPVWLKMRRQGAHSPDYQGASKLLISVGSMIIAELEVYITRESPIANLTPKMISGRPISLDPVSAECFSVARAWLSKCTSSKEHTFCREVNSKSPLPTRLIDIGPSDGSHNPRLVLSATISQSGSRNYAALSHCWGPPVPGQQPVTTETGNIQDRMKSIPMDLLTRTFRDAVIITRNLGLRYIWIDSLCIIQNSKSDWQQEASRMADVYKNAYVTIAAESSTHSNGGMLNQRHFDFSPIEIPFNSKIHNTHTTMFIRPVQQDWATCITGEGSALNSRAWVLQEALLSPRTIHFTTQQMFWECMSSSQAEGDLTPIRPKKSDQDWSWSRNKRFLSDMEASAHLTDKDSPTTKNVLYMRWHAILQDYSTRKMTQSSDVFPALGGLASEFNIFLKDQYLAGLWKGDLLRGLLWTINEPEPCQLPDPWRAPSWSWASKIGAIGLHIDAAAHFIVSNVEILDSNIVLEDEMNIYGQVSAASLTLRGRWKDATHWPTFDTKPWENFMVQNAEDTQGFLLRDFDIGREEMVLERKAKARKCVVLQIARWGEDEEGILYGLILESGDHGNVNCWTRVGAVQLYMYPRSWLESWDTGDFLIV